MVVLLIIIASFAQMLVSLTFDGHEQGGESVTGGFSSFANEYLKAYTIMLGDIDMEFLQAHSAIVILFVLYTFGVTIVLLNILIAIVSESYASAVFSSNLMLGKARILFVSDIMATKSRYQMNGGAIEKSSNMSATVALVLSAVWIKSIISTVQIKMLCMKMTPQTWLFGLSSIEMKAVILFLTLVGIIRTHKTAMTYSLAISPSSIQERRKSTQIVRAFSILAEKLQAVIGRNIDSLMDNDGAKTNLSELEDSNAASHRIIANDRRMQRALGATRKELKAELKRSQDQLRHIIHEAEDKTQASIAICEHHLSSSLADVASMQERIDSSIAASEERIVEALSSRLDRLISEDRLVDHGGTQAQEKQ